MEGKREVKYERELQSDEVERIKLECKEKFEARLKVVQESGMPMTYPHFSSIMPAKETVGEQRRAVWVRELIRLVGTIRGNKNADPRQDPHKTTHVLRSSRRVSGPWKPKGVWGMEGAKSAGLLGNSFRDRAAGEHLDREDRERE